MRRWDSHPPSQLLLLSSLARRSFYPLPPDSAPPRLSRVGGFARHCRLIPRNFSFALTACGQRCEFHSCALRRRCCSGCARIALSCTCDRAASSGLLLHSTPLHLFVLPCVLSGADAHSNLSTTAHSTSKHTLSIRVGLIFSSPDPHCFLHCLVSSSIGSTSSLRSRALRCRLSLLFLRSAPPFDRLSLASCGLHRVTTWRLENSLAFWLG